MNSLEASQDFENSKSKLTPKLISISFSVTIIIIVSATISFASALISPLILIFYLLKNRFSEALVFFIVCLFFSDSAMPLFFNAGNDGKNFMMLILGSYCIINGSIKKDYSLFKNLLPFFLLASLVTFFGSINSLVSYQKLLSYILLVISLPTLIKNIKEDENVEDFLKLLIYTFLALFFYGLFMKYSGNLKYFKIDARFNGIQRNPNGVGISIALLTMLLHLANKSYNFLTTKKLWAITLFLIFILLQASSRTAIFCLLLFFGLKLLNKGFFINSMITGCLFFLYENLTDFVVTFAENYDLQKELRVDTISFASGRIYVWEAAKLEIEKNFWFGHGFTYDEISGWIENYHQILPDLIYHQGNIHNTYLTFWMNTGLIGLILFFTGLILFVLNASKLNITVTPVFFASLFLAYYENWLVASLNPFTILFFTSILIVNPSREISP